MRQGAGLVELYRRGSKDKTFASCNKNVNRKMFIAVTREKLRFQAPIKLR